MAVFSSSLFIAAAFASSSSNNTSSTNNTNTTMSGSILHAPTTLSSLANQINSTANSTPGYRTQDFHQEINN